MTVKELGMIFLCAGVLVGCSPAVNSRTETKTAAETTAASAETTGEAAEESLSPKLETEKEEGEITVSPLEKAAEPENMALYASVPFFHGDKEWQLQMFVQEDMVADGELVLDDRCHFIVRAVSEKEIYQLFDETVQLGTPEGDVWEDTDGRLHVVIRDIRTARYRITDYVYDEEEKVFQGQGIIYRDGINYWGTVKGESS
ncbi:MAG TPA: hypothetical protein H9740_05855 [Candidatus Hungatella pullicola]|nr:hypothetical protein [Candidatus Hungatella pullicola]